MTRGAASLFYFPNEPATFVMSRTIGRAETRVNAMKLARAEGLITLQYHGFGRAFGLSIPLNIGSQLVLPVLSSHRA